ncbi:hypothetical protein AAFF_G00419880 [Aldrovandia affinis]|uniref:Uncharacterized protein n=1 Tax=Aldrovandia affinis TaxID=143900 RepID=A0AAD7SA14_9TELE|nr:hypothetical protein AAFF_G00419880 [Aldrovandia affinis]
MVEDQWRVTLREVQQLKQSAQLELCKAKLEVSASEERHLLAVMKLREEHHMDSLGVLGIMAGEMEKEKASHGDEMRRVESHNLALQEQVRNLTQMRENEQRQCLDMQESQDQATDEYARALEDVQTRLAQKEAELRKAAENQASEAEQLRCRVEQVESILTENDALRTNLAALERIQTVKTQEMNVLRDQTMALNVELQQRQTEQEKLLAQRDDVSSQLQEVNCANSRLLEQLTERGQEKDKLQQELEETWKTADKRKAMLDELAIDVAQEKLRHKEELQAQIQSMEGTKGWFERRLKEAEETAEKSALEHQEQVL